MHPTEVAAVRVRVAQAEPQQARPSSPLVKEIETICTYELDPANPDKSIGMVGMKSAATIHTATGLFCRVKVTKPMMN